MVGQGIERAGRAPGDVDVMSWLYVSVDDDPAAARTAVSKIVLASLITSRPILDRIGVELPPALRDRLDAQGWRYPQETPQEAAELLPDHIVDAFAVHGTPAQVRQRLDVIRDCGIDHVAFVLFPSAGNSAEALARRIALEIVSS
jgi:alkanesulfonate monooxygenase SsuD/methylene tetrahydromethanopterin reductase-like flavin-dependent oxidoreductase (luciferase family)